MLPRTPRLRRSQPGTLVRLAAGAGLALILMVWPSASHASLIVRLDTVMGEVELELFDQIAPKTVANFLAYTQSGAYDNSFFHRSVNLASGEDFVIQGGGFRVEGTTLMVIPKIGKIDSEFQRSNLRGTIAMALSSLPGEPPDPDSATSQWFINLSDANRALDASKFTVFGEVVAGMDVVDAIATLPTYNLALIFSPPFNFPQIPLIDYTSGSVPTLGNLVLINEVIEVPEPSALLCQAVAFGTIGWLVGRRRRRPHSDQ